MNSCFKHHNNIARTTSTSTTGRLYADYYLIVCIKDNSIRTSWSLGRYMALATVAGLLLLNRSNISGSRSTSTTTTNSLLLYMCNLSMLGEIVQLQAPVAMTICCYHRSDPGDYLRHVFNGDHALPQQLSATSPPGHLPGKSYEIDHHAAPKSLYEGCSLLWEPWSPWRISISYHDNNNNYHTIHEEAL